MKKREGRGLKGSITVEMAYIMPVTLMIFFLGVLGIFYYHDKNIIIGCAYETAVIGSIKAREGEGVSKELLKDVFKERSRGKTIAFTNIKTEIEIDRAQICVRASASYKKMKIAAEQRAALTKPEEYIRDKKGLK